MSIADAIARIEGHSLDLRLVQEEDAEYIFGLRTNPAYNAHLSQVTGTVADQQAWIRSYKAREAVGGEFYFVVERKDGQSCGVVRLYDINGEIFSWGSWILDKNKPAKAALESAVLSFGVGFDNLGLNSARLDVRVNNTKALAFYRRFGMTEVRRDDRDIYFSYSQDRFLAIRDQYIAVIKEAQSA